MGCDGRTGKELGGIEPRELDAGVPKDCEFLRFRTRKERMQFTGVCSGAQESAAFHAKTLQTQSQYVTSLSFLPYPHQS